MLALWYGRRRRWPAPRVAGSCRGSSARDPRDVVPGRRHNREGDQRGNHVPDPWRLRGGGAVELRHADRRRDRGRRVRRVHGQGARRTIPTTRTGLKPRLVTNWTQFESLYGGFTPGAMLPHSVYGYFNNGGALAYIVRIPHTEPATESGTLALPSGDRALGPAVEFTTVEPERRRRRHRHARAAGRRRRRRPADVPRRRHRGRRASVESFAGLTLTPGRPQRRDRRQQGVDEGQGGHEDRRLQARGRPGQHPRRQLRHRAGPADAGRRARPGVRRLARPPARASTAWSSPRTSRW